MKDLLVQLIIQRNDVEYLKNIKEFDVEIVCETVVDNYEDPNINALIFEAILRYLQIVWNKYTSITNSWDITDFVEINTNCINSSVAFRFKEFIKTYNDNPMGYYEFIDNVADMEEELKNFKK